MCSPNTYACKGIFNSNIQIFQPNCAEGLRFSTFHSLRIYITKQVLNMCITYFEDIFKTIPVFFVKYLSLGICGSCSMNIGGQNTLACIRYVYYYIYISPGHINLLFA